VDAGPEQTVGRNRPVVLDASRSTSVGSILHYEWDLNGDGTYDINVSNSKHTYPGWRDTGVRTLTLRATDDGGRNATAQTRVTVIRRRILPGPKAYSTSSLHPIKQPPAPVEIWPSK